MSATQIKPPKGTCGTRGGHRDTGQARHALVSLDAARIIALADLRGLPGEESPTGTTVGRILAADLFAAGDLPHADIAAMDGIAVRLSDIKEETPRIGPSGDSRPPRLNVRATATYPICTGMRIPSGFEAVVPIERVQSSGRWLTIEGAIRAGDHIRRVGEEIRAGELAAPAGARINPATIGLLSALGHAQIGVCATPRVGVLVTGEELRALGSSRASGLVVDSNGPMLEALVAAGGGIVGERPLVKDDPAVIHESLVRLAADHDLVITSGGASVGARDHLIAVIQACGELMIHQLDIKPGRPTSLGRLGGTPIVLLPGNPLAALIGFEALGRPILRSLAGDPRPMRPRITARAEVAFDHKLGRMECVPVQVSWVDGFASVTPLNHRGSGMLRGASCADGIAILEAGRGSVVSGEGLAVELWI